MRDVRKRHGDDLVFPAVRFTVAVGEAVAIVGRNGSGKSTLLKCLVGLVLQPGRGPVLLCSLCVVQVMLG